MQLDAEVRGVRRALQSAGAVVSDAGEVVPRSPTERPRVSTTILITLSVQTCLSRSSNRPTVSYSLLEAETSFSRPNGLPSTTPPCASGASPGAHLLDGADLLLAEHELLPARSGPAEVDLRPAEHG